jgi:hypothetical protein
LILCISIQSGIRAKDACDYFATLDGHIKNMHSSAGIVIGFSTAKRRRIIIMVNVSRLIRNMILGLLVGAVIIMERGENRNERTIQDT